MREIDHLCTRGGSRMEAWETSDGGLADSDSSRAKEMTAINSAVSWIEGLGDVKSGVDALPISPQELSSLLGVYCAARNRVPGNKVAVLDGTT
uniref:Uncharacterized protein n=1 Tax=Timema douglasi TaxID=61478 RepID=A0A7R8VEC6_TIMDO|nr:unnamed protein product [Timema douglasi]